MTEKLEEVELSPEDASARAKGFERAFLLFMRLNGFPSGGPITAALLSCAARAFLQRPGAARDPTTRGEFLSMAGVLFDFHAARVIAAEAAAPDGAS